MSPNLPLQRIVIGVFVALAALVIAPSAGFAQPEISIDTQIDRNSVEPGDDLRYEINVTVNGNYEIDIHTQPGLDEFGVVGRSVAPSLQIRNGQATRSIRVDYRLRAPSEAGTYSIAPPEFRVGDRRAVADAVTVQVSADAPTPDRGPDRPDVDRSGEEAFVEASLDPDRSPYVGEQVLLRYDLFINHRNRNLRARPPGEAALDDFWIEDLTRDLRLRRSQTQRDGQYWTVTPLRVQALFPLRSGPTVIDSIEVPLARASLFGRGGTTVIESEEIELDVKPLPDGAPRGFSPPNVGDWRFDVDLDSSTARVGGQLTITAHIDGVGRVERLGSPDIELPEALRKISVEDDHVQRLRQNRIGGKRTFKYHLMPLEEGPVEIPPLVFSYFDPDRGEYITHQSEPQTVHIEPGQLPPELDEDQEAVIRGESWSERSPLADLHGLADSNDLETTDAPALPWWLFALPIVALLLLALERPLVQPIRRRLSPLIARRRLQRQIEVILADEEQPISTRCLRALRIALNDCLNCSLGALDAEDVSESLSNLDLPASLRDPIIDLVSELVAHRYTHRRERTGRDFVERTESVISTIVDWRFERSGTERAHTASMTGGAGILLVLGIGALLASMPLPAEASDDLDDDAVDWSEVAEQWKEQADANRGDINAQYNAGTAAAHTGDLGLARLYLERALLLGPDAPMIRENLDMVTAAVAAENASVDAFRQQGSPAVTIHAWAPWLVLISLWLALIVSVGRRLLGCPRSRARFAIGIATALLVALVAAATWLYVERFARTAELGVVIAEQQHLRQGPSPHASALTESHLPPGAITRTEEQRDGWRRVQLPNGLNGWMPAHTIEAVEP